MDVHYGIELTIVIVGCLLTWWLSHRDAQAEKVRQDAKEAQAAKDAENHESFQQLHERINGLRDKLDEAKEKSHQLELASKDLVQRIEMDQLRKDMTDHIDAGFANIVGLVTNHRNGGQ